MMGVVLATKLIIFCGGRGSTESFFLDSLFRTISSGPSLKVEPIIDAVHCITPTPGFEPNTFFSNQPEDFASSGKSNYRRNNSGPDATSVWHFRCKKIWSARKKIMSLHTFLFDQRSLTEGDTLCHLVSNWSKLLSKKIRQTIPNDIFDISLFSPEHFG